MGESGEVVITDAQLAQRLAIHIRSLPVSGVRVLLQTGQIIVTGRVNVVFLSVDFKIVGHPVVQNGHVFMVADRVEPGQIVSLSPIKPGNRIDLGLNFEATGVQALPGRMVVTGRGQ